MAATTAQADPMVPLAPPCDQWVFPGDVLIREGGTGWDVSFSSTGQAAGGRATATHGGGETKSGNISGTLTNKGHVELTVRYDNGQSQRYIGDVGDDAKLRGKTENNIFWSTVFPISCNKAPLVLPLPEPAPEPEQQAPLPTPMATVLRDTDFYDKPDGIGTSLGFLEGGEGQQIQLIGCTKQNWCQVVMPQPDGRFVWVWGGDLQR